MGCAGGRTKEGGSLENNAYPVCRNTIPISLEVHSLVAYSDDKILIGGRDELQIYDSIQKNITTVSKEHKGRINVLLKLKNGKIVSAGQDKTIKLWDIENKKPVCSLSGHKSMIWCIGEVEGGKLISGSSDNTLKIWDLNEKKLIGDLITWNTGKNEVSSAIQLKSGKILLCSGPSLIKFDLKSKKQEKTIEIKEGIWAMHELKNGDVAAGLGNGNVVILDVKSDLKIKTQFKKYHNKAVSFILELDNGRLVSASDEENNIAVWDPKDSESIYEIKDHTNGISGLAYISGRKFASVSKDNTMKIWE